MRTQQLIAAALLALAGTTAFAGAPGDYDSPARKAVSTRNRDAVIAEVQNLRAQGGFVAGGELVDATATPVVAAQAVVLTRAEVKAELTAAQQAKALPRNGELM